MKSGINAEQFLTLRKAIFNSTFSAFDFLNDEERKALKISGHTEEDAAAFLIVRRDAENRRNKIAKGEQR